MLFGVAKGGLDEFRPNCGMSMATNLDGRMLAPDIKCWTNWLLTGISRIFSFL